MFHSVSLFSQAPLAHGSRALPSVLFNKYICSSIYIYIYEKGDVGMAKRFSERMETRDELSTTCNPKKLCQDVGQRLMLHPYSLPPESRQYLLS